MTVLTDWLCYQFNEDIKSIFNFRFKEFSSPATNDFKTTIAQVSAVQTRKKFRTHFLRVRNCRLIRCSRKSYVNDVEIGSFFIFPLLTPELTFDETNHKRTTNCYAKALNECCWSFVGRGNRTLKCKQKSSIGRKETFKDSSVSRSIPVD